MLTLKACLDYLGRSGSEAGTASYRPAVDFFRHDLITSSVKDVDGGCEIWVGEAPDPFETTAGPEARFRETRAFEDFDGLRVRAAGGPAPSRVTAARTAGGTSPLYVSAQGPNICMSWRFEEVVALLDDPRPNVALCRLRLEHGKGQTREQIIEGVYALWPGEAVTFDGDGLRFQACTDVPVVLPSSFSDRARATDAFIEAISTVLRPALTRARRPLLEFSGGMDSTCVALAASGIRDRLDSYGVIHPGAVGRQQRARREELIELLRLRDHTGSSTSILPIQSLSSDDCHVTPNDDVYRMCLMKVFDEHGLSDVDLVVSGLGGDELTKDHTYWRQEWELPGYTSSSSIVGSMSRADMFMRRGIWPVNPFANPAVVNLCRALPARMRKDRALNRLTIARAGLSDGYLTPRYHETFANVLSMQAVECDVDHFFDGSMLADYGIMDTSRFLAELHENTELGIPAKLIGEAYYAIKMEVVLRRYVR